MKDNFSPCLDPMTSSPAHLLVMEQLTTAVRDNNEPAFAFLMGKVPPNEPCLQSVAREAALRGAVFVPRVWARGHWEGKGEAALLTALVEGAKQGHHAFVQETLRALSANGFTVTNALKGAGQRLADGGHTVGVLGVLGWIRSDLGAVAHPRSDAVGADEPLSPAALVLRAVRGKHAATALALLQEIPLADVAGESAQHQQWTELDTLGTWLSAKDQRWCLLFAQKHDQVLPQTQARVTARQRQAKALHHAPPMSSGRRRRS